MEESLREMENGQEDDRTIPRGTELLSAIKSCFGCEERDVRAYSPLTLAYIGDGIFDLVIRTVVVERANRSANDLHRITVRYVKAQTQAGMAQALIPELD